MTMKKIRKWMMAACCILCMAGCGGNERTGLGNRGEEEAAGAAVVIQEDIAGETGQSIDDFLTEGSEEAPQNPAEGGEILVDPSQLQEPEIAPEEATEVIPEIRDENRLQIVFLGDSILDGYRNETGIAYLTGVRCNADVYNLAMRGTSAALTTYEKSEYEQWDSRCLQGVVHAICGNVDPSILNGHRAGEVFATCDFSRTDYFVIEYGMNDFLAGLTMHDEEDFYDEYTYVGALRVAVQRLREHFPQAEIVLCSPNYAQFWGEDGAYLGDGNMVNNGGGTLVAYHNVCLNVATDMNTLFLDGYNGIGLDAYTADEYLEDGVHLSQKGRDKYAEKLSEVILKHEETKNN